MLKLFKKTKPVEIQENQKDFTAPGTSIKFSPSLINKLEDDHKTLLSIFTQIQDAYKARKYKLVQVKLKHFKMNLMDHLLVENLKLYVYLSHCLVNDDVNSQLVREFRTEMDGIAKAVMTFVKKYETIGVNKELAHYFERDLEKIGIALVERIMREEKTLYPLYIPGNY